MITLHSPLAALRLGQWFKLICGASYQDVSKIRNLSLVYSLAGADCIDVAADLAVVNAAWEGIVASTLVASSSAAQRPYQRPCQRPWLMVSLNDGQDPHFRKAWFDGQRCPSDCLRPCERVCPANAISTISSKRGATCPGVVAERCYGCGRCLPVCPYGLIEEQAFTVAVDEILPTLLPYIDAVEIHTKVGRQTEFQHLWQQLAPYISQLQLVAVSCPDSAPHSNAIVDYLTQLYYLMLPKPQHVLWQTDGRPMSGDIGRGTTRATVRLAQKVLNARLPGYVQLAGGTNDYTVDKLRSLNLLQGPHQFSNQDQVAPLTINGVAYGSYARQLVNLGDGHLEDHPQELWQQVSLARNLVSQIKSDVTHESFISQISTRDNPGETSAVTAVPP